MTIAPVSLQCNSGQHHAPWARHTRNIIYLHHHSRLQYIKAVNMSTTDEHLHAGWTAGQRPQITPLQWRHMGAMLHYPFHERHGIPNHRNKTVCSTGSSDIWNVASTLKKTSNSASLSFCDGDPSVTGGFPHEGPVMRKAFPLHDVIMNIVHDYTYKFPISHLHQSQSLLC